MTPKISILLPAMLGAKTVSAALEAWDAQTRRDELEILILCPDDAGGPHFPPRRGQVLVPIGAAELHEARAIGIERASAEFVMLAEDHCLPDPGWAEAILDRLEDGRWDGVGPALRAGNRTSCWAAGSFLIGYGEWMMPVKGGPTNILCGWNGTIRTRLLRSMGAAALTEHLLMGAFLIRRLREQGHRFYLEERARMRHFDPSGFLYELFLLMLVGLGFGAMRTRRWPLPARFLYPLAGPAVALAHFKRAFVHYRRAGAGSGLRPSALAAAVPLAIAWGLGEAVGAWVGVKGAAPHQWRTEVKPVSREEVERSDREEMSAGIGRNQAEPSIR